MSIAEHPVYLCDVLEARGEARGKVLDRQEMILTVLQARFHAVPADIAQTVEAMVDLIALKSLAVHAVTCQSLEEFTEQLP